MKTKILVSVLMLITVAATAQTERRGSSNSNGSGKENTEERKTRTENVQNNRRENSGNTDNQRKSTTVTHERSSNSNEGNTPRNESNPRSVNGNERRANEGNSGSNVRSNGGNTRENSIDNRRQDNSGNSRNGNFENDRRENNNGQVGTERRDYENRSQDGYNRSNTDRRSAVDRNQSDPNRGNNSINRNPGNDDRRYANTYHKRVEHHTNIYRRPPESIEVRREYHPYRRPVYVDVYWTSTMRDDYYRWYPEYRYWNYSIGHRIEMISAYDAYYYMGEVARVYGRVHEVIYSVENDEYYLYFGYYYPHHDFSVVLPGWIAREYSHKPFRFFNGRHVAITGLITMYDGKPEIMIRRPSQLERYY